MKTGRYSAEEQRLHDEAIAKMALTIRLRADLTYPRSPKCTDAASPWCRKLYAWLASPKLVPWAVASGPPSPFRPNKGNVMAHQEFKYIAVRNWAKYQEKMKNGSVRRPFIKDAVAKDSDPDYSDLSFFQRYVLDGLRRLTALHGQNPRNDAMWVARALCANRTDRPHVPHAVATLTARGFLILTNQGDPFSQELKGMERKGIEGKDSAESRRASGQETKPTGSPDDSFGPVEEQAEEIPPARNSRVFQINEED